MTSSSRPTANITSLRVNGSRWPAERLVVLRTPLATARILPTSREYSVTMRSASPRSIRFRMTAGVRYRRCLVTACLAFAGEHTGQRLDESTASFRIDLVGDVLDGWDQDFAFLAADNVDVVRPGFDDVGDYAERLVRGGVLDAQTDDLVPVELAFGQAHGLLRLDFDFGTA